MKKLHITDDDLFYEKQYPSGPIGIQNWEALRDKLSLKYSGVRLNAETYFYYGFVYGTEEDLEDAAFFSARDIDMLESYSRV